MREREKEKESITIDYNIDLNERAQNKFIKMLIFNLLKKITNLCLIKKRKKRLQDVYCLIDDC